MWTSGTLRSNEKYLWFAVRTPRSIGGLGMLLQPYPIVRTSPSFTLVCLSAEAASPRSRATLRAVVLCVGSLHLWRERVLYCCNQCNPIGFVMGFPFKLLDVASL